MTDPRCGAKLDTGPAVVQCSKRQGHGYWHGVDQHEWSDQEYGAVSDDGAGLDDITRAALKAFIDANGRSQGVIAAVTVIRPLIAAEHEAKVRKQIAEEIEQEIRKDERIKAAERVRECFVQEQFGGDQ